MIDAIAVGFAIVLCSLGASIRHRYKARLKREATERSARSSFMHSEIASVPTLDAGTF